MGWGGTATPSLTGGSEDEVGWAAEGLAAVATAALASHLHFRASKELQGWDTLKFVLGKQTWLISWPEWPESFWGRSLGDTKGSEASCPTEALSNQGAIP